MDPEANIAEQTRILASSDPDWERLAELILALDGWFAAGGFMPRDWWPSKLRIQRSEAVQAMIRAGVVDLLEQ